MEPRVADADGYVLWATLTINRAPTFLGMIGHPRQQLGVTDKLVVMFPPDQS